MDGDVRSSSSEDVPSIPSEDEKALLNHSPKTTVDSANHKQE